MRQTDKLVATLKQMQATGIKTVVYSISWCVQCVVTPRRDWWRGGGSCGGGGCSLTGVAQEVAVCGVGAVAEQDRAGRVGTGTGR